MNSVNKAILIGNLAADPEIKIMQSGDKIAKLRLATSERWKDKKTGETKERTEWHNVSILQQGLVAVAEAYLAKGDKVYLSGKIQTRKWQDQGGTDRYSTEIVLSGYDSELVMLSPKKEAKEFTAQDYARESGGSARAQELDDPEIPF